MRKTYFKFIYALLILILILIDCLPALAQVATGTPPFGSFGGGADVIDLGNLNAHLAIPVSSKAGRGMPFTYTLTYDSSIWSPSVSGGSGLWTPVLNWGWLGQTAISSGYIYYKSLTTVCGTEVGNPKQGFHFDQTGTNTTLSNFTYFDVFGIPHPFTGVYESEESSTGTPCGTTQDTIVPLTTDGSGYSFNFTAGTITSRTGRVYLPPQVEGTGSATATDRNGNQIKVSSTGVFTDTLGTTALTVAGSSPTTFTYTAPSGANASYTMNFTTYTVATNFGYTGITEYGATAIALVSSIALPDGTQYTFTYEPTPSTPAIGACTPKSGTYPTNCVTARIASVQLPTGGTISYTYSAGYNGIQTDGSTAGLTRTTPDGTWTYARSGSGTAWTTTISDPSTPSNQSVLSFQAVTPVAGGPAYFYETEKQVYQGSTSGTLLTTTYTCYNGAAVPCNSTAVTLPIASRTHYVKWPGGLESETNTTYNAYGSVTEKDEYAYGSGAPGAIVRKTLTAYAGLGNGIVGMPATVTVEDGSSNVHSQTSYSYDQPGSLTATSGTPQQVAITGSRGNATTISYLVRIGTSLSKTYTYYDTGNVSTATDSNGAVTTYTYGSGTSCGNSFATSVAEPLSLSVSMVWNCAGGVQTSGTDENGQPTTTSYNDPYFWRPNKVTDAASDVANFTYDAETSVEGYVDFNGTTSTADALKTVDGLGRTHISQTRESPSSSTYDSVETDYDSLGRVSRTTLPYAAAASTTNPTAPSTNTTYDALNRKLKVTDNNARSVTYAYTQNDTYRTLGPAPTGENTKRKQSEYDALGRTTSICEVTNATGSGTCAQTSTATGYWTEYSYDVMNHLTGVTQNAQSSGSQQTRTYAYDDLGRLTLEANPESATTTYTYDTDTTCGTSSGDLVKKVDAVGNTTCYVYDARHRITSTTYTGPYSANTPTRYFVYDAATVNSVAMANAKTRVAEAYTCVSPCSTKITDLGFSYTVLGQPTDVYESTPHSAGYYHVTSIYYANGALNKLSNLVGLPMITYGVDGEGRVNSASASSGQNPLSSTTYSTASLPTLVTLGSSDSDSYTYDPNSNRMTKYTFAVNGQSVVGSLTWNPIGTLETLGVTDPFYSGGNQTCNYAHDDVSRIASANCGSPWAQTFGYDAFGNISKSGTISFQPTYSYLTNRMTQIGSSTPTYDLNGNVLTDTAHTYAWDATGRPVTIDSVTLIYDALGRMVEQDKSGVYSEIAYAPAGGKLAIMSGQSLTKAFVPLSGGAMAVYNSSGLAYYRHSDWLGSSRFASTPARALYFDGAYAPFGENYAQTGTTDLSFTGMNQDTVSNLFDFPAREYNAIHGRWPSPDPAGILSVHMKDPQSWNRYAYVGNRPLSSVDPTGLDKCDDDTLDICNGTGGDWGYFYSGFFSGGDGGGTDNGGDTGSEPNGGDPNGGDPNGGDSGGPCSADPLTCGLSSDPTNLGGPTDPSNPSNPPNPSDQGCAPGDFSCNPFSNDGCVNPFAGSCGSASGAFATMAAGFVGDPCVFSNYDTNGNYTGTYSVNTSMNKGQCSKAGGQWSSSSTPEINPSTGKVMSGPLLGSGTCAAIGAVSTYVGVALIPIEAVPNPVGVVLAGVGVITFFGCL
jgi:RHS repeat-associated protein